MPLLFFFLLLNFVSINGISRFSLSQSINLIGIKSFLSSLSLSLSSSSPSLSSSLSPSSSLSRKPLHLFQPLQMISNVKQLNLKELEEKGIKGLVFDKDNTLTCPYQTRESEITREIKDFLSEANKIFNGNVAILSNSVGSIDDIDYSEAQEVEKQLGIPVIRHQIKKPGCIQEVLDHFSNKLSSSDLCMIGDRVTTDILFGNMHNMHTILVDPITSKGDNLAASLMRSFERKVLLPSLGWIKRRER